MVFDIGGVGSTGLEPRSVTCWSTTDFSSATGIDCWLTSSSTCCIFALDVVVVGSEVLGFIIGSAAAVGSIGWGVIEGASLDTY